MNVLVVGGSGLIGGDIALHLSDSGHEVTVMARKKPGAPRLAALPFLQGNYVEDDFRNGRLEGFDALVFAAAADIRHMPHDGSVTPEAFYTRCNDIAVPAFFEVARESGVERGVYISTFYPLLARDRVGNCPYVTSRYNTETAVNALNAADFKVLSLNPGFVWGYIEGLDVPHINGYIRFLKGELPDAPVFAPPGGSNHMTSRSIAQATLHALEQADGGRSYLLGDENHSWKGFMELGFKLAGRPREVPIGDGAQHPFFPDVIMFAGAGKTVSYEPDAMDILDYDRQQMRAMLLQLLESV